MAPGTAPQPGSDQNPELLADDTSLPFFDHPRFQQIYKEWLERGRILDNLGSIICTRSYEIRDVATLRAVLDDACVVYDVATGKTSASVFLSKLEKVATPSVFYGVMLDLSEFLAVRVDRFKRLVSEYREKIQSSRS